MNRKIRFLLFILVFALFLLGCSSSAKPLTSSEVYEVIAPSTVEITASSDSFSSLGSGFYIDDAGTVVTNYHVIEGCSSISVRTHDGGIYSVTSILGYDEQLDIALLSTSKRESKPVEFATEDVSTGETVYALGSSLGLTGTFSEGLVSTATREIDGLSYIQISAPISSGNSGGPLVNDKGQVIGITSAGFIEGQNLNLAIPVTMVEKISTAKPLSVEEFYDVTVIAVLSTPGSIGVRTITLGDSFTAGLVLAQWENRPVYIPGEEYMIQLMNEYGAGQGGGQLYIVNPGDFVEEIDSWCFDPSRQVGDVAIIENPYGFSICYISSIN